MRCRRNTLVRAPLFSLIILSARATLPPSLYLCFFISTTLPPSFLHFLSVAQSLYPSSSLLFFADAALSGFLMRCQVLRWNGGGGKMPLKTWCSEWTCASFPLFRLRAAQKAHTRWRKEIQSASKAKALCETVVFEIMLKHTCVLIIVFRYVQCEHYCAEVLSHPWFFFLLFCIQGDTLSSDFLKLF